MGTITGNELITRTVNQLQDPDHVRWSMAELLDFLHDAQRDIVMRKPDAYTKSVSTVLTVSETKQSLPSDAILLLDITRNMGTDGSTPGRVPTRIEKPVMDQQWPNWMTDTGAAEVQHYMYDEKDPSNFYIYPPQPASSPGYLGLVYSAVPAPLMLTWRPLESLTSFLAPWDGLTHFNVLPTIRNDHMYYRTGFTVPGVTYLTDYTEPTWPLASGQTIVDSATITWTEVDFDVPFPIILADTYANMMVDYMIAQALFKDANISPIAGQKGLAHYNNYLSALGVKEQAETVYDPNLPSPAKPSTRGI